MKERIVIVVIAVGIGLFITTIGFLIYQSTKFKPAEETPKTIAKATIPVSATPIPKSPLMITEPKDEAVVDRRTIKISGQTKAGNTIVISSNQEDVVATPDTKGKFSASITIDAGINKIVTRAISADGSQIEDTRIVTYSTEEF